MPESFSLEGQIALVTGAASGIGRSVAIRFAAAGARVLMVDLDADRSRTSAAEIPQAEAHPCDITDPAQVARLFAAISHLDILVNCAGIGLVGNIEETELADFENVLRVNVAGMFLITKAAIPLVVQSHGSILNIGSVAGSVGVKRRFAYCASKGAVHALTHQLAVDYPTQFRVNCIAPGTVDTPFVEGYLEKYHRHEKEKVRAELNGRQPIGRLGRPEEIADLALFISSPAASFMNGSIVTMDGGWTAA